MKRSLLGALAVLVVLAAPAPASAATTLGQVAPPGMMGGNCFGGALFFNTQTGPGTPSYAAPNDGVVTSWSAQGGSSGDSELKLKVVRDQLANYRIVGADPTLRTVPANTLSSFDARVPVAAGDLIALWVPGVAACVHGGFTQSGHIFGSKILAAEPGIGAEFTLDMTQDDLKTNLSAQLEPDADGDEFGDETQDGCPSNRLRQDDCSDRDPPQTEITKGAPNKLGKSKVRFRFTSDEPGSTFECKLDKQPYKACTSPRRVKRLDDGKHKFKVIATDKAGNADPSAAKDKFKVVE